MIFAPKPRNDFREFISTYYDECRARVPRIAAIAGKWTFADLIPGMSDFDTRFILEDDMTTQDWCDMSAAVGEVHLDLCRRHPRWARNLEHLPGVNVTWTELADPATYYPEYPQWSFHHTTDAARLRAAEDRLARREWDRQDEHFHLKRFCLYYGRYDRTIDPPINLGRFESKYPLHSRFMHYFCPPLQSALSMLLKRPIRGKMETVRIACEMFDDPVFHETRDAVDRHYELPDLYEEPATALLDDRLERALDMLRERLAPELTLIPDAARKGVPEWKACLDRVPLDPFLRFFDASKFSRLMKGRLAFYAYAPPHFDSTWCIENELRRMRRNLFDRPLSVYCEVAGRRQPEDPLELVRDLCPALLTAEEVRCVREFVRLLPGRWEEGKQREIALALAGIFDGFFSALAKIGHRVREISEANSK